MDRKGFLAMGIIVIVAIAVATIIGTGAWYYHSTQERGIPAPGIEQQTSTLQTSSSNSNTPQAALFAQDETVNWRIYKEDMYGFEVKIPPEASLFQNEYERKRGCSDFLINLPEYDKTSEGGSLEICKSDISAYYEKPTPESLAQWIKSNLMIVPVNAEIERTVAGNFEGERFHFEEKVPGNSIQISDYIFTINGENFFLIKKISRSAKISASVITRYEALLEKMFASLRFFPPKQADPVVRIFKASQFKTHAIEGEVTGNHPLITKYGLRPAYVLENNPSLVEKFKKIYEGFSGTMIGGSAVGTKVAVLADNRELLVLPGEDPGMSGQTAVGIYDEKSDKAYLLRDAWEWNDPLAIYGNPDKKIIETLINFYYCELSNGGKGGANYSCGGTYE